MRTHRFSLLWKGLSRDSVHHHRRREGHQPGRHLDLHHAPRGASVGRRSGRHRHSDERDPHAHSAGHRGPLGRMGRGGRGDCRVGPDAGRHCGDPGEDRGPDDHYERTRRRHEPCRRGHRRGRPLAGYRPQDRRGVLPIEGCQPGPARGPGGPGGRLGRGCRCGVGGPRPVRRRSCERGGLRPGRGFVRREPGRRADPRDPEGVGIEQARASDTRPHSAVEASHSGRAAVRLLGCDAGHRVGHPRVRAILVRRNDVDLAVDRSAYFTSDRTAIRATMRVSFAFPHAAAIQKISLD